MDEFAFINWIKNTQKKTRSVICGIGDDCAVINVSKNNLCIITADMLLEGTHFDLAKHSAFEIGRKSIACSVSDIAAMGCQPSIAVVSLCFPNNTTQSFAKKFYKGMRDITEKYDISIVGGDIISGKAPFCVNITLLGKNDGLKPVLRKGARLKDLIFVTGSLGGSILGKHISFEPRLKEGIMLNKNFIIHAMIDISDGLTADLSHILKESHVGAVLYEDKIPVSGAAAKLSKETGRSPLHHALTDGEDYELLFVLSGPQARKLLQSKLFPKNTFCCIGEIVKGRSIWMKNKQNKICRIKPDGYKHV